MLDFVLFLVAVILFFYFIVPVLLGIAIGLFGEAPPRPQPASDDAEPVIQLKLLEKYLARKAKEEEERKEKLNK